MQQLRRDRSEIIPAPASHRTASIERAMTYLERLNVQEGISSYVSENAGFQNRVRPPAEVFSNMLILNALADCRLPYSFKEAMLHRVRNAFTKEGFVHFFEDKSLLPADLDCTALGLDIALKHGLPLGFDVHSVLDRMAALVNARGIVRVYLTTDPRRSQHLDAAVGVNALHIFYTLGRGAELAATEDYVGEYLASDACLQGTRYYPTAEMFFMFLSRLVTDFELPRARFACQLAARLRQRVARAEADPVELAGRIIAASAVGVGCDGDLRALAQAQRADGSWPAAPCFRYGRTGRYFGGEALSTAFAIQALLSKRNPALEKRMAP